MDQALKEGKLLGVRILQLGAVLTITHILAVLYRWYHTYPSIDIPQHFLGGVLAALLFYWLHYTYPKVLKLIPGTLAPMLLVVSWAAFLGLLFEFGEFLWDFFIFGKLDFGISPTQLSLRDTMGDLFFDAVGGLALAIFMRLRYDKRKRQL